jgi:hypothetical protein
MATTTPNYGWSVPTSTDLVKDGATAIETLGDSADATVKALNPETTLGDISYRSSTANTNTRLAIGSSGQVLTVSGGVPAWVAPTGGVTLITRNTFSAVNSVDIDSIFSSTYATYLIAVEEIYHSTAVGESIYLQFRYGSTTQTTSYSGNYSKINMSTGAVTNTAQPSTAVQIMDAGGTRADDPMTGNFFVGNRTKKIYINGMASSAYSPANYQINALLEAAQSWTGIRIKSSGATNINGTVAIYGWSK